MKCSDCHWLNWCWFEIGKEEEVRGGGGVGGPSLGRVQQVWPWEEDEQGYRGIEYVLSDFDLAWPGEDWTPKSESTKMIL